MAKFKLSLIVPNNDMALDEDFENRTESYLSSVITDFTDQQVEYKENKKVISDLRHETQQTQYQLIHTTSYTYNEKLSKHKNGQEELTFNLDDKVIIDNEWIENPFARILRNGVLIELQDKYKNRKLFVVNKIQHNFNNVSIVYNITCIDLFTYQLNRQNNGYSIVNDETSEDFIGALDIDQWAYKIEKECYISYQYIPLDIGIFRDINGVLHTYEVPGDDVEQIVPLDQSTLNVDKIIKPIYNKQQFPEYYETIPFSISGTSANAALIALGEVLGLQINVVEGLMEYDSNNPEAPIKYVKYFYFGPTKNTEVSGLTYTPLRDVQTFGLSFSGDSLTTVLNINSTTWNDEEISVFPTLPPFFNALFNRIEWKNSTYYPGFFIEAVKGKEYSFSNRSDWLEEPTSTQIDGNSYFQFKIKADNIKWPEYYTKIKFYWEDKEKFLSFNTPEHLALINPFQSNDVFLLQHGNHIYHQNEDIEEQVDLTDNWYLLVKDPVNNGSSDMVMQDCYFTITRDYSNDEVEFAKIAEECPWLENKLMDFSYFVRQGILSRYEYDGLMNWLLNNLRIINGQLMCNAQAYYWALYERTKILARIEQDVDALGATFHADVVDPYTKTGTISNISSFINTYHSLFETSLLDNQDTGILDINNIISDRFNKYFSANQRFLKHIYNFRQYFNSRNIYATNSSTKLDDVNYRVESNNAPDNYLISFDGEIKWDLLTSNSGIIHKPSSTSLAGAYPLASVYRYSDNKYLLQKIPTPTTYQEFYVPNIVANAWTNIEDGHVYNPANLYYLTLAKYIEFFGNPIQDRVITKDGSGYVRLSRQEVIKIFLNQELTNNSEKKYYLRDTNLKVPFEWVRANYDMYSNISLKSWPAFSLIMQANPEYNWSSVTSKDFGSLKPQAWELYKNMLPVEELYIYDYNINYTTAVEGNATTYNWSVYTAKGKPYAIENGHFIDPDDEEQTELTSTELYRKWYSIPFVNYSENESSLIYNASNATSLSNAQVLNLLLTAGNFNNSKYYVSYTDTTQKGWAIAGGVLFSLFSSLVIPGAGLCCFLGGLAGAIVAGNNKFEHWGKKNTTDYNMKYYNSSENSWKKHENKYKGSDLIELGTTDAYRGDSHWVNYVLREDSEIKMQGLTQQWWDSSSSLFNLLDNNDKGKYKHYINYYQYIATTYSQGAQTHNQTQSDIKETNLSSYNYYNNTDEILFNRSYDRDYYWIKNRYGRFCKKTDGINYQDEYVFVPVDFLTEDAIIGDTMPERFGAIKYYSLVDLREHVNFRSIFTLEELKQGISWTDVLARINSKPHQGWTATLDDSTYVKFNLTHDGNTESCYVVHLEPYEKLKIAASTQLWSTGSPHLFTKTWKEADGRIYHWENDRELENQEIILQPITSGSDAVFFYIPEKDDQLIKVQDLLEQEAIDHPETPFDWTDINVHWYSEPNIDSRTYTIDQILGSAPLTTNKYYYLANTQLNAAELRDTVSVTKEFDVKLRTYTIDENSQLIIDDKVYEKHLKLTFDDVTSNPCEQTFNLNGYEFTITRTIVDTYNIGDMTNGEFWYYFHNRLDFPTILESAIIIETQLTTEWMQAYTASNYCEWFIPEYWQQEAESYNNAWSSAIWLINKETGKVTLSNELIPDVEIYSYQDETNLDGYLFHYHYRADDLCDKEELELNEIAVLKTNPAITMAIEHIFDNLGSDITGRFTAQRYSKQSYYYHVGGGIAHKNILRKIDSGQRIFKYYDGLYCMQLYLLLSRYHALETPQYFKLWNTKLKMWRYLYERYPGIFLENTYSNNDVRSSQQLLQMAKLAFKDYTSPEKQYNITIIDAAALAGYHGQELRIGDNILLNTSDYYDIVDETYRALNQYLFISDISYNLRSDTDISLTVNTIKYQDKLLQSLVKLIR